MSLKKACLIVKATNSRVGCYYFKTWFFFNFNLLFLGVQEKNSQYIAMQRSYQLVLEDTQYFGMIMNLHFIEFV